VNCFVISLHDAIDRRKHIIDEFGKAQVDFDFFDALRPNEAKQALLEISINCDLERLSPGEKACLASHVVLWKKLLESKQEFYLVFEDDVFLGKDAAQFFNEIEQYLAEVDLIKLETFQEKVLLGRRKTTIFNRNLSLLKSGHSGTAGYLVTRAGAKKLIDYLNTNNQIMPADHYMFEDVAKEFDFTTYQVEPALCIQEKVLLEECQLSNSLDQARENWILVKSKKSLIRRILRELRRFLLKQKLKYFSKIVDFK